MSQEQLALKCNLGRRYIGLLERAQCQPSLTNILKISIELEVKPWILIKEVDELCEGEIFSQDL